ncbi:MAG: hypothetical protein ACO1N9_08935 [Flavobacterium sp.]
MAFIKTNYPLQAVEDLHKLIKQIRENIIHNKSLIKEINGRILDIIPVELDSKFIFKIVDVKLNKEGKSQFLNSYCPTSTINNEEYTAWHSLDGTLNNFKQWSTIIERYSNTHFTDSILEQYEDEIYEGIKILDEDADEATFEFNQQILLLHHLQATKLMLASKHEDVDDIIRDVETLQGEVTKLSKNAFIKKFSSILAKGKKHSMELFKDMLKDYVKDFFKDQLKNIPQYIDITIKAIEAYNNSRT